MGDLYPGGERMTRGPGGVGGGRAENVLAGKIKRGRGSGEEV